MSDIFNDEELSVFKTVAETRSFSRAARQLGMAQSSVSQRLARLEGRVGRTLIQRTTRRVELTSAGTAMLYYATAVLALADEARRQLAVPPVAAKIRFGIAEEFALTRLASVLGIFREHFAHRFEMSFLTARNDHLFDALNGNNVDVVVGKRTSGLERGQLLWKEPLVWVGVVHGFPAETSNVPLLAYLPPSETREAAERALRRAKRAWTVVGESENLLGLLAAAEAGLGVLPIGKTFVPKTLSIASSTECLPDLGTVDYVVDRRSDADAATIGMAAALSEFASQISK